MEGLFAKARPGEVVPAMRAAADKACRVLEVERFVLYLDREVCDRSCAQYPLNSSPVNPPVRYGARGEFLSALVPGAYVVGVDLQDCSLHWLVAPSRRRCLGVRHPITGALGVYLFLPFGLGAVARDK